MTANPQKPAPNALSPRESQLLWDILASPAAPFRETPVLNTISTALDHAGVPWFQDRAGNLVVGVESEKAYRKLLATRSTEPLRVFIAHTDHPGFIGAQWSAQNELTVDWHGGTPTEHLEGSKVWLATDALGLVGHGEVVAAELNVKHRKAISTARIKINDPQILKHSADSLFGGFAFRAPVWQEEQLLYTKAADDLVGSAVITQLAIDLFGSAPSPKGSRTRQKKKSTPPPFIGLLTRAEEVGFIGLLEHLKLGYLQPSPKKGRKREIVCVSLETSRTLPGAEIGKGPVVRLGDKFGVFHAAPTRVLENLAKKHLPERHQKRIMDGGTCEGTATLVNGLQTLAISIPLGNYHNQSLQGGPDAAGPNGPAPEFVHLHDIQGMLTLCRALLTPKLPWTDPYAAVRKEFVQDLKKYKKLMVTGKRKLPPTKRKGV
jgi:putative aminopeptidase FrvX